ncbi:hypothetical protein ACFX12_032459 [Malus domestica]
MAQNSSFGFTESLSLPPSKLTLSFSRSIAVVTGANRVIGFGTVKQLASNGITVVLTAKDENRGLEVLEKLKELGFFDRVVFHQLDVTDSVSVARLADFVKTQFGKLDILVSKHRNREQR